MSNTEVKNMRNYHTSFSILPYVASRAAPSISGVRPSKSNLFASPRAFCIYGRILDSALTPSLTSCLTVTRKWTAVKPAPAKKVKKFDVKQDLRLCSKRNFKIQLQMKITNHFFHAWNLRKCNDEHLALIWHCLETVFERLQSQHSPAYLFVQVSYLFHALLNNTGLQKGSFSRPRLSQFNNVHEHDIICVIWFLAITSQENYFKKTWQTPQSLKKLPNVATRGDNCSSFEEMWSSLDKLRNPNVLYNLLTHRISPATVSATKFLIWASCKILCEITAHVQAFQILTLLRVITVDFFLRRRLFVIMLLHNFVSRISATQLN